MVLQTTSYSSYLSPTLAIPIMFPARTVAWNDSTVQPWVPLHQSNESDWSTKELVIVVGTAGSFDSSRSVSALVGAVLRFEFPSQNYTLTQNRFYDPCESNVTYYNGLSQFVPSYHSGKFVVDVKVVTAEPQWFYCGKNIDYSRCNSSMLFSVNSISGGNHVPQNVKNSTVQVSTVLPSSEYCHLASTSSNPSTSMINPTQPMESTPTPTQNTQASDTNRPEFSGSAGRLSYGLVEVFIGTLSALIIASI
jgi:hypothetical protein